MKVEVLYSTFTRLEIPGGYVYFSYETPVAAELKGRKVRRKKAFSATTSRHLKKFCSVLPFELVDEDEWKRLIVPVLEGREPFPEYEPGKPPRRILDV